MEGGGGWEAEEVDGGEDLPDSLDCGWVCVCVRVNIVGGSKQN